MFVAELITSAAFMYYQPQTGGNVSLSEELAAKLVKDETTLARVMDRPNCSQWYIDHLKARIEFDKKMIVANARNRVRFAQKSTIDQIQELVEQGVLSRELCPEPDYWHWNVLRPDLLPFRFQRQYRLQYGEIRWYGEE